MDCLKENHLGYNLQQLAPYFPVRIEVVFERNTPSFHRFQRGESVLFFHIGLFSWVEETHVPHQKNDPTWRKQHLAYSFSWELSYIGRDYFLQLTWLNLDTGTVCSKWANFAEVKKNHVSLKRKPSILEAVASSTFFSCETRVNFWKNYFMQITIIMVEKCSFCSVAPY